ncbi:uncharacterized protein LOC114734711 isoform X2 [Neltuma alba]|uniref:uncharacterized protein LOC114734711 isoform X2 n=1 Tax=Neltuma alba TaxID=207710 RepID=UPI0010A49BB5|nr:uncharacterized protein LOC114734711 isoform X2 [Prosopis alba]
MKIQDSKFHNNEKPFPGCLGRMVNLFDLTAGVTGNRLLTDKPHLDAFPLSRSQSDVARIARPPFGDQLEDKMIVSDLRRSSSKNKINGTPIKMLIDQEMSKEVDSRHSPPNVVAKLMGLESLPWEEPNLAMPRGHKKDYSQHICGHSGMPFKHWQLEDRLMDKEMLSEVRESPEKIECKDIYELWRQPQRTANVRDKTAEKGMWTEDVNEKKMALIRQKFMEAKRLSTDERLRQSKEFEDALEVLSSNKDLFLRFLDSQNLYELQSTPQPQPATRRITVLKPSKMLDDDVSAVKERKNDKQNKKPANVGQAAVWNMNHGYSSPPQKVDDYQVQHTRIVVLKPSSGKTNELKAVASPTCPSPRSLQSGNFHPEYDVRESRKIAKEISCQVHRDPVGHQRDEALHSSVCSNGYTGDESSFNRSENDYAAGNFSELEIMSPSPRHSWDYVNRYNGPYSPSSFSRASYSPESSVCREAKKRLSERWAMIASNKGPQEQRHLRKSSSLGEMLALSDAKKSVSTEVEDGNKEQKPRECSNNSNEEIQVTDSPKNLARSKSVPASSSTIYDSGLGVGVSEHKAGKVHDSKDLTKPKSMKSFKGRVTSLFFSRNKKATKEKSSLLQSKNEPQSTISETSVSLANSPGIIRDNTPQSISTGGFGERPLPTQYELSGKTLTDSHSKGQGMTSLERGLTGSQPIMPGISSENQDQPSPISVLEPLFRDDHAAQESLDSIKAGHMGVPLNSNLIDKSPPIESISRTLSWEDSCAEVATRYPLKSLTVSIDPKVEEQDWLVSVQKLLLAAGLDDQVQSDSFHSRWHSLDSPLDPSLRDKYANSEKEPLHEAKRRHRRSNQKLVFDCVNDALKEITGYESEIYSMGRMCSRTHGSAPEGTSPLLVDLIVTQIKELISSEVHCVWGDCGDGNSLVVERFVRKEVVGKGWIELLGLETANLGKEIEGKLLEELVEEAVVDLTGRTQ